MQLPRGLRAVRVPVLIAALATGACSEPTELPVELRGRYGTTNPLYADRFFEIGQGTVILGLGEGRRESHEILDVLLEQDSGEDVYVVRFSTQYGDDRLAFHRDGDEIVLENQPRIRWRRVEP